MPYRFYPFQRLARTWPLLALLAPTCVAVAVLLLWTVPARAQERPVHDFDKWCKWRRGDQAWATLTQASDEVHQGKAAGKLAYDFPADEGENFVVFQCAKPLTGTPQSLSVWVYGDGSGNLLNAWVQDGGGLRWQFAFGPVNFTGWQRMTATLLPGQPWPNGPLDGSGTDTLVYPIKFDGLVLDNPGSDASSGEIYLDDLTAGGLSVAADSGAAGGAASGAGAAAVKPKAAPTEPAPAAATEEPKPEPEPAREPEVDFSADADAIEVGECTNLRWTVRNVKAYFLDGEGKAGDTGKQEVCPEETTTYTLRVRTQSGAETDYRVEIAVTGEPPNPLVVEAPEVLEEPSPGFGLRNVSGISAAAVADCVEARKLKCSDMSRYGTAPTFAKSTRTCLVWLERGTTFGTIDIAVNRASNPEAELWASSRDSLGNSACIGLPVKITAQGTYEAVLTANNESTGVRWKVK